MIPARSAQVYLRSRSDRRAFVWTLTIVLLCAALFRITHFPFFASMIGIAMGLYVIRFGRLTYREPDITIEAWQSFYSYLRPGSLWSRRFLRVVAIFSIYAGVLYITSSLVAVLPIPPVERAHVGWLSLYGSPIFALLLLLRDKR